ncbi:hypothetical protein R5W24_003539 [Gemmata sp. JC717]|uniref:hypothetical protein n=1 Tax=Gemmata algarum TaxID=2975278 RepID=UPI0021BA5FF8|nr:hypothetical protein [Gemmata algarum]MDY3554417.1 hypothetical protein [Gemmata algarum]
MRNESKVREVERRLRDVVNRSAIQDRLMLNKRGWEQLCASMDVIGDTDLAVEAFLNSPVGERDYGLLYLHAYGLLQALFVQQDAVEHAAEAIGVPYTPDAALATIRNVRNDIVGHPTKRGRRPESFGIVRISLSTEEFRMFSFDLSRPNNFQSVRFRELIDAQRVAVVAAIEQMISHLQSWPGASEAEPDPAT